MQISVNPLTPKQQSFLKSRKSLGLNKSQYQKDILSKLDKSIRYLHHILIDTYNLPDDRLYEILNANTLRGIIEHLVLDKTPNENGYYRYDFRTIEIARLLFNIIEDYFMRSPYFIENEAIRMDIARVHHHFVSLARFGLEKQAHDLLDKDKEKELAVELFKLSIERSKETNRSDITSKKKRIDAVVKELNTKYSHLKPYACPIDQLHEIP